MIKKNFLLVALLFIGGCSLCHTSAEKSFLSFMDCLKQGDFLKASEYINSSSSFIPEDPMQEKILKALTSRLSYSVLSSRKDGEFYILDVEITSVDMKRVMESIMADLSSKSFSEEMKRISESGMDVQAFIAEVFIRRITNPNSPMKTSRVSLYMRMKNRKFIINDSVDLANSITGGMLEPSFSK